MGKKMNLLSILFMGAIFSSITADPVEDKNALLDFLHNIQQSRSRPLNWNTKTPVCGNWTGVTCNTDQSRVVALRLPGMGLRGSIPANTLSRLSWLHILSLRSNSFSGSIPLDFSELRNLTALYLQINKFSGKLPDFSVWNNLTIVNLSDNGFNGSIPVSVSNLTHLLALNLSNNSLSGSIPDLNMPSLQQLNLSNNNLTGIVPRSLQRFPSSSFSGNNLSPETALPPTLPGQAPEGQPPSKTGKVSESALLGIVLGGCVLGFLIVALLMILCYYNREGEQGLASKSQKKNVTKKKGSESQDQNNRLVFFEGCNLAFDLEDLLRASAEVLGKGTFGVTYKAALEDASTVAVKRLKEVTLAKREFEQQMEVVGSIKHENVSALRAYFYSKDEKLVVHDFYDQGSVSAMLHGKREGREILDWETRLKIAVGAARGIAHIHTQNGEKLVHGNIKASNIFLNSRGYGCVSDIGLATLMSPVPPPAMRAAGYRAPEVTDSRKATQISDVYSFGVLVLELLTGKSPTHVSGGDQVVHLVRWVHSVVREEWTAEVFDVELLKFPNIEEEMVEMLQIGMRCVVKMPDQRPKMQKVVRMLEEIRAGYTGDQPSSETSASTPVGRTAEVGSSSSVRVP
ncbi:hypothetical protein SLA2020_129740 [Shorea laevis]